MKQKILILVISMMCLTACGSQQTASTPASTMETDADGNMISEGENYRMIMADQLPATLPYNGQNIVVNGLRYYQETKDYEHYLYVTADVDLSALSDEDFHWIFENDEFKARVDLSGSDNQFKTDSMPFYGHGRYDADSKTYRACWRTDGQRYGFDGIKIALDVTARYNDEKPVDVYYTVEPDSIPDRSEMTEADRKFVKAEEVIMN